ncbi:MAG: sigma-54-dependent Fis family transcriptional regulator [Calditrichales bacterium]|nr:MAG: sigma-54-dependent Fis family transcriptional regulator [Calditrichales bacterium]
MKTKILIVDDEVDVLELMSELFESRGYIPLTATNGVEALKIVREDEPDMVISDIRMPDMDGMQLLEILSKSYPNIPVIMVTAHGTIETAVEAIKMGARDYVLKPLRLDEILTKVETIAQLKNLEKENEYLKSRLANRFNIKNIIGKSSKMNELFKLIHDVAPTSTTVLIQGENGTGKELIANAIHYNSPHVNKPFIKLNCAVLAETLLESELFGHVKGAFTGAIKDKIGRFELANHGTLFLDEIGEISQNMQVKLLRVLQEGEFEKVGGTETIKVDVRIIAATNQNLQEKIKNGSFRQDLFYRLNVIPLVVPPLSERKDDIELLVTHFLEKFDEVYKKNIVKINQDVLRAFENYEWPGNIRELENYMERAIVLNKTGSLTLLDFPEAISHKQKSVIEYNEEDGLVSAIEVYEKELILSELDKNRGNKAKTAQTFKMNRSTFMSKLKKYDIGT